MGFWQDIGSALLGAPGAGKLVEDSQRSKKRKADQLEEAQDAATQSLDLQREIWEWQKKLIKDQAKSEVEANRKKLEAANFETQRKLQLMRSGRSSTIHTIDKFNQPILPTQAAELKKAGLYAG